MQILLWQLFPAGMIITAILASSLLSQKSLAEHVEAVADALDTGGLALGRIAVSHIVGRDPEKLDRAGVCRAAIESLAENFSDGIVAPAFWIGVGGLAGGVAYKAANTADSMIGHRTPRHEAFGWAAARFDDLDQPAGLAADGAADRCCAAFLRQRRRCRATPGARCGATRKNTARPMPAGRKRRWPARSAWRWPARAAMAASWSRMPSWAKAAGARPTAADIRRALKLYPVADYLLIALFGIVAAIVIVLTH